MSTEIPSGYGCLARCVWKEHHRRFVSLIACLFVDDGRDSTLSAGYTAMLEAAEFQLLIDRIAHVRLAPPRSMEVRQVVLGHLRRMRELFGEHVDVRDLDILDVLIDDGHPLGTMRRPIRPRLVFRPNG